MVGWLVGTTKTFKKKLGTLNLVAILTVSFIIHIYIYIIYCFEGLSQKIFAYS